MADKEYIEREALERYIRKEFSHLAGLLNYVRMYCPTADVVDVRHGKWDDCECSVCGNINPTLYLDEWEMKYRIKETPYCPNCGAKMDGKGEG